MGEPVVDLEFEDKVVMKLFERVVCDQEVADRFKAFFAKHRHKFDADCGLDAEQKLEYTAVFQEYSQFFDDILGDVVADTGCDRAEIAERCTAALAGGGVDAFFLNAIVAASSYEKFIETMADAKPDAKGGGDDDAKGGGGGDDAKADAKDVVLDDDDDDAKAGAK